MPAELIDGRAIAKSIHAETAETAKALKARGIQPGLAFVRVGEDPASQVYVGMKERMAEQLAIHSITYVLPEKTSEQELLQIISKLNGDPNIHGILVQSPIPSHVNSANVYSAVSPSKDVDGFHPINMGKLLLGDPSGFVPCTPAGVHELLIRSDVNLEGANVVILGRGNIVGKPMAALLLKKERHKRVGNSTVTVCHSYSQNIAEHCCRADIVIAAMGLALFVKKEMVRAGATVVDVGVNRVSDATAKGGTRLVGDVDFMAVKEVAGKLTPNPGGVGPMTIAMLMHNTVRAAVRLTQ